MKRYLLFDSGCSLCTKVAREVEREAGGWLEARSLREPEMRALLDRAKPGWKWEPTLVEVAGDEVRVYQGLGMRVRMVEGLGLRRAWKIGKIVREHVATSSNLNMERRSFLKQVGSLTAVSVMFGVSPIWTRKIPPANKDRTMSKEGVPHIGPMAWAMGIRKYEIVQQDENSVELRYYREDKHKSGYVRISRLDSHGSILGFIKQGHDAISLTWDIEQLKIIIRDSSHNDAHFVFDDNEKIWKAIDEKDWAFLREYDNIVATMAAIGEDVFPLDPIEAIKMGTYVRNRTRLEDRCCHGPTISHTSIGWTRTGACNSASGAIQGPCSNQYCWGCCSTSCDCSCLYIGVSIGPVNARIGGGHFCVCTAHGTRCSC